MNTVEFKDIIKELRIALNKTQEEFGKLIGVPRGTVNNWERGQAEPDIAMLKQIASTFHITMDELLQFEIAFDPNETNVPKYRYLSEEESELVDGYRTMNKHEREFYLNIARNKLMEQK